MANTHDVNPSNGDYEPSLTPTTDDSDDEIDLWEETSCYAYWQLERDHWSDERLLYWKISILYVLSRERTKTR